MSDQPLLLLWQHAGKNCMLVGSFVEGFVAKARQCRAEDSFIWIGNTRLARDVLNGAWIIAGNHTNDHALLLEEFDRVNHAVAQGITQNHRANRPPRAVRQILEFHRFIIKFRQHQHP